MTKEIWINLPVKDPGRSKEFFAALGFAIDPPHPGVDAVGVVIGDPAIRVMLFPEATFQQFTRHGLPDTETTSEVLFSFGVESRGEVDELARKVVEAGGTLFADPAEIQGSMYGCGFIDPDGHRWNALYMGASGT